MIRLFLKTGSGLPFLLQDILVTEHWLFCSVLHILSVFLPLSFTTVTSRSNRTQVWIYTADPRIFTRKHRTSRIKNTCFIRVSACVGQKVSVIRRLMYFYNRLYNPFPISAALPNVPAGIYYEYCKSYYETAAIVFRETGEDFRCINYDCLLTVCIYESFEGNSKFLKVVVISCPATCRNSIQCNSVLIY